MMKTPKLTVLISLFSITFGNACLGAELKVPGSGATPCAAIAELGPSADQAKTERINLESWGQGFLGGLMTAHAMQFARSSDDATGTGIAIDYNPSGDWAKFVAHCQANTEDNLAQAVMAVAVDLGVLQDQDPSVPGVYLLIEVNGGQLPAVSWKTMPNGDRCSNEIFEGAVIFDAEGRSSAYISERDVCLHDDGSESTAKEGSVIFPGTYVVSGNQITIKDDFGTDHAVLNGKILVYKTGGEGRPVTEYAFRKQ
jgi:hypothetical protein